MMDPRRDEGVQNTLDVIVKDLKVIKRPLAFLELDSTNDFAIALAKSGHPSGTLVMATFQPKGRGRLKRSWMIKKGDIALSIIVRPEHLPRNWALYPMIPALAVVDAFLMRNIALRLKWPNDIVFPALLDETLPYFLHFRKLGGILVENVFHNNELFASVIGIGINMVANAERKERVPHSISLEEIMPTLDRSLCLRQMLICLDGYLSSINTHDSEINLFQKYIENCETLGRHVVVQQGSITRFGKATRINTDGSLVIHDGKMEHIVFAGDVNLL